MNIDLEKCKDFSEQVSIFRGMLNGAIDKAKDAGIAISVVLFVLANAGEVAKQEAEILAARLKGEQK